MNPLPIEWEALDPKDPEDEYRALVRALRRGEGFGMVFVKCSPAQGERIVGRVQQDLTTHRIDILRLKEPIDTLYDLVEGFPDIEQLDVLFVSGLEYSIYDYEDGEFGEIALRSRGKLYDGSWLGVPRLLGHLNLRRESFRDHFNLRLVFLVPEFVLRYFILRAPDFFDWRSAVLEFPMDAEHLQQESRQVLSEDYEEYLKFSPEERWAKLLEIRALLVEPHQTNNQTTDLYFNQGNLLAAAEEYQAAIDSFDQALRHKPDDHTAWYNRGNALDSLGRYEEAIDSYDQALRHKPDYPKAWYNRGNALDNLGRYEEAIDSFDRAIQLKPDYANAFYNKACCYGLQGKVELALENLQHAIHLNPDQYRAMAKTDSDFDAMRGDDRFQALLRERQD